MSSPSLGKIVSKAKRSPSAHAMAHLVELGYVPWVVERNITPIIKRDLFNCIDIIAIHPIGHVLAVQVTSAPNHAARATKCRENEHLELMLGAGWTVEVWSYKGALLRREQIVL